MDTDLLISLVQKRPVLWDKTLETYKNKAETRKNWEEICNVLNSDFESYNEKDKNKFYKEALKRWSNIRDSYCKSKKKLKENKKSGTTEMKKYVYHDQLQFLNRFTSTRDMPASALENTYHSEESNENCEEIDDRELETVERKPAQKRKLSEIEETDQSDRHLSFFQGIIPSLNSFDEDEILDFQLGVIQLIKKIKYQKACALSMVSSSYTQPSTMD